MERFRKIMGKIPTGLLSGITLALILWFTLAPHPVGDTKIGLFPGADKVIHALMFGALTFVILLEMMKHRCWTPLSLNRIGITSLICALFGLCIEIVQRKMGMGRTFETLDILADTAGAVGFGGIWAMIQSLFAKSQ